VQSDQHDLAFQALRMFLQEVNQIAVHHAPRTADLPRRVEPEVESQRQWRPAIRRYELAVASVAPAAEFYVLLRSAFDYCMYYLPRLRAPQTPEQLLSDTFAFESI
jgi:hypothetical protein